MLFLFKNPINIHKLENYEIRKKWDNKKFTLRFFFAIFTSILIVIGIEFSSPEYSTTTIIVERAIENSDILKTIIENHWLKKIFIQNFDKEEQLPIYTGKGLKFAMLFIIFLVVSIHFLSNDPLSDSILLRNLEKKSKNFRPPGLFRFMSEINFYAENLPSNRLPSRCSSCDTPACGNRLAYGEDKTLYHWNSIVAKLSPSYINELLYHTHKCRFIFFLRYSVWASAFFLSFVYIFSRIFELYGVNLASINYLLLYYIILLIIFGIVIGLFNSPNNERTRGFWGQFSEIVNNIFHSDNFKAAFTSTVCKYGDKEHKFVQYNSKDVSHLSGYKIQRLITVLGCLDNIVKQNIKKLILGNSRLPGDKKPLIAILIAMIKMLKVINHDEIRFRCTLFVKNDQNNILEPLICIPFINECFISFKDKKIKDKLSYTSDSIASRSFQKKAPISACNNQIPYFHEKQKKYLKSMIAIPLELDRNLIELTRNNGYDIDEIIGVLTVDSDDSNYFCEHSHQTNLIEILPFVNCVVYEMISSLKKTRKTHEKS
ncbi:hypothetical protein DGMP_06330 [Desulfomarina profundi]|uniref:Uncharacterized protein n=1 Tax=Desulfomarina profundi TaxID=2772557 RepID=A0A8D5FLN6_9BACT|nr:hypothetical protein [Desulfomarina profundi]BCL59940.1 hypothetical protein DGMP_06330 [Desulfomarina profundi]